MKYRIEYNPLKKFYYLMVRKHFFDFWTCVAVRNTKEEINEYLARYSEEQDKYIVIEEGKL